MSIRFRASGTDASGSNYTRQRIEASSTSVSAVRETSQTSGRFGDASAAQRSGYAVHVYGPFLAQPTALRSVSADGQGDASILENAVTHSLSTSYDGFSIILGTNNFSGALQVYGLRS